jgi:negative regulator of sigma E activity
MNEQRENLSSLLDDYRAVESDQTVLDEVLKDVNQRYTLRRYQLMGDVMRNDAPASIKLDFAAEVMAQIEQEPALSVAADAASQTSPEAAGKPSWFWSVLFKPMAGVAVAATVAFVAVSSVQLQMKDAETADQVAQNSTVDAVTDAKVQQLASIPALNAPVQVSVNGQHKAQRRNGMNWKIRRGEPAFQKKLNTYLINHNEFSKSMQGIIPQVRVVGFDAQK